MFRNVSLSDILPGHIRDAMNTTDFSLFYRLISISVEEKHILIIAQIEWKRSFENDLISNSNTTNASVKWDTEDRLVAWIDDAALNDFLNQVFRYSGIHMVYRCSEELNLYTFSLTSIQSNALSKFELIVKICLFV